MQVGRTALMIAAREGDKEIFDLQLEYDADVVQVDWVSFTIELGIYA
jgi:ankyrin repeat protein